MGDNVLKAAQIIRLDQDVVPLHYDLDFTINPRSRAFRGHATIELKLKHARQRILFHSVGLNFDDIEIFDDLKTLRASIIKLADDGTQALDFVTVIGPGPIKISFKYHAPFSKGLEGLYLVDDGGRKSVFTQFQAIGARRAFPCFDEPGFKTTFDVVVRSPKELCVISNALETHAEKDGVRYLAHRFATTKALPTYLIAIAVGDFDVIVPRAIPKSDLRSWTIPLRGIAMRGKGQQLKTALAMTSKLVLMQEEYFGIAYPFDKLDIIAVPDFGAGGMENAGAITYDEALVLMDEAEPVQSRREFLSIHAHEIAHQWFGNLVTPKWWDDLWLNESFATLMESRFAAMMQPRWHFETDILENAHEAMILDGAQSVRCVREAVTSIDGISGAFDAITYQKGGAILAMVEAVVGPLEFQYFVQEFLKSNAYGSIDSVDFLEALEARHNGVQAAQVLRSFISNAGLPVLKLLGVDSKTTYRQSRFLPLGVEQVMRPIKPWTIPLGDPNLPVLSKLQGEFECADLLPIDEVPRYFVFDIPIVEWMTVLGSIVARPRAEALTIAINFDLALMRGQISLTNFIQGIGLIAKHKEWLVAGFPLERLEFLARTDALNSEQKKVIADIYRPRIKKVGLVQKMNFRGTKLWLQEVQREDLANFFVATNLDVLVQLKLAKLGDAILRDEQTALDETRIAPYEIVEGALVSAAKVGGNVFVKKVVARLNVCADASEREIWLRVIAVSPASEAEVIIHNLIMSRRLRTQELPVLLHARASQPQFCNALWDLIERNMDALLMRLNGDLEITLIQVADEFSSEELARRVKTVITPYLGRLRGGAVQLAQTLERISMNVALLKHLKL